MIPRSKLRLSDEHLRMKLRLYSKPGSVFCGVPCRLWTKSTQSRGYGLICVGGGRSDLAHRVSYELDVGPIPKGLQIDHLCRNVLCCESSHLEAVPAHVNNWRSDSATSRNGRKLVCVKGHHLFGRNLVIRKDGRERQCRTCGLEAGRRYRMKKAGGQ